MLYPNYVRLIILINKKSNSYKHETDSLRNFDHLKWEHNRAINKNNNAVITN